MKIVLTRRQRWELANLFLSFPIPQAQDEILPWIKLYNRTRLALGLTPIMDITMAGAPIRADMVDDTKTLHNIEEAQAKLVLDNAPKHVKSAFQAAVLGPLFEILEGGVTTDDDAPVFDAKSETWKWVEPTPPTEPSAT